MTDDEALDAARCNRSRQRLPRGTLRSAPSVRRTIRLPPLRWSRRGDPRRRDLARAPRVLFLDELPEFDRGARGAARAARVGRVSISRRPTGGVSRALPARRRDEPVPCGYLGHLSGSAAARPIRCALSRKLSGAAGPDRHPHRVPAVRKRVTDTRPENERDSARARRPCTRGAARAPGKRTPSSPRARREALSRGRRGGEPPEDRDRAAEPLARAYHRVLRLHAPSRTWRGRRDRVSAHCRGGAIPRIDRSL